MTRAVATSLGSVFGSTWVLWPVGSIFGLAQSVTMMGFCCPLLLGIAASVNDLLYMTYGHRLSHLHCGLSCAWRGRTALTLLSRVLGFLG